MAERGAIVEVLSPTGGGTLRGASGGELPVDKGLTTMASVLYDAVAVAGGAASVESLLQDGYAVHFVTEAYRHLKPILAFGEGSEMLRGAGVIATAPGDQVESSDGVVTAPGGDLPDEFVEATVAVLAKHRVWDRETDAVPA